MQADEPTDVTSLSVLLVFVRYRRYHHYEEQMFMSKLLPAHTEGKHTSKLTHT
jgi:hypothetical protein